VRKRGRLRLVIGYDLAQASVAASSRAVKGILACASAAAASLTVLSFTAAWIAGRTTGSTGTNFFDHRWSWLSGLKGYVEEYWITLRSAERQRGALMRRYAKDVCRTHGMEDAMA